ncbi:oligosaccharide flippase family protein [Okibacterium fritillariae]|uniref:Membrane protein involved in the export of O-antigen and teichoic acid n=1 Tax=Okibacterium fritillariae TaxID=123320 RepID=A0A1T5KAP4_9MICO|nr:oligosaccharide flippase family protein [Okibacterium fritillariae]SKC60746.1 Membrane protein involved in the export of O-antigen and teichoic acid [Okibacterium fritillariae]
MSTNRRHLRLPWSTLRSWFAYAALPLVGVLTAPLLARALGPEGRGELAAILQPLSVADAFAAIGVPAAATYFVARGFSRQRIRKTSVLLLSIAMSIVSVVLFFYSDVIADASDTPRGLILLLWGSVIVGAFVAFRRGVWQGLREYRVLDAERASSALIRLLIIVVLFGIGVHIAFPFAVGYIAAGILASAILFLRPIKKFELRDTIADSEFRASDLTRYALLTSLSTVAMTLNNRLDQAALPAFVTSRELGFYSVAVTVAEIPVIITTVMTRNLLAEASAGAPRSALVKTTAIGLGGVLFSALVLAALAPWAIPFVFGPGFVGSVSLVWVLLLGTFVGAASTTCAVLLAARGRPGLGSLGPAVGALTTIAAFFVFRDVMTVWIAAYVAVVAQMLAFATAYYALRSATLQRKKA